MIQPNAWSCLPCAFSNAIGHDILSLLSHDGSEIVWPELPEPYCRRAFHPQECIVALWDLGWTVTAFEMVTLSTPPADANEFSLDWGEDIADIMDNSRGVAVGVLRDGRRHALAWNGEWIDSGGVDIEGYTIETFYAIVRKQ